MRASTGHPPSQRPDRDFHDATAPTTPLRAASVFLRRAARRIAHGMPLGSLGSSCPARPASSTTDESRDLLLAFNRYGRAYFQRWLLIGVLIGIVAGIGAIVFASAIAFCTHLFLGGIPGFLPPAPAGEGATRTMPIARPWLLPVVTTLGGLLTGLIVFTLAPEAEGHGTDAAIEAFREKGGRIRSRIPLIKLIASAITIGSGGSAGREGPTAQISAGFGSWLGDLLHLDEHDRRIAVSAGIGSGIGAIFKAPFGGALLSAEILYNGNRIERRDTAVDTSAGCSSVSEAGVSRGNQGVAVAEPRLKSTVTSYLPVGNTRAVACTPSDRQMVCITNMSAGFESSSSRTFRMWRFI